MSIDSVMPSHHFILWHPPFLLPSIFPRSGSFPMSWLLALCMRWPKYSASASVLPMNIHGWLAWSPCSPSDSQESSPTPQFKSINSLALSFLYSPILTSIHDYLALTRWTFVGKVMSLLFGKLSKFAIAFLPRSKCLLISGLQSPSAMIFSQFSSVQSLSCVQLLQWFWSSPNKVYHWFHCFPIYLHEVMEPDTMILLFWILSFKPTFHSSFSPSSRGSLVPLHFLP